MTARSSFLVRPFEAFPFPRAPRRAAPTLSALLLLTAAPALASPDCSKAGVHPSPACAVKLDYCNHTAIVTVLAVRAREAGTTEAASFATLSANTTHEAWYEKNRAVIKDIVHTVHSEDAAFARLKERIGPLMALGIPTLANGCSADTAVEIR